MRIYLSGPITGKTPEEAKDNFLKWETKVNAMGHTALNPERMGAIIPGATWDEYIELDICLMKLANGVLMLPGWEHSEGAKKEHEEAVQNGMKIYYAQGVDELREWR